MTEKKRPPKDWEGVVDKQIREAIERGDFQNLPGRGRPLDLGDNPFTPRDWKLAYKMLKDAGVTPEWIQRDKEIRLELQGLVRLLEQSARLLRERATNLKSLSPDKMIAEYQALEELRTKVAAQYSTRATELNRVIDTFNLQVPSSRLQHPRIQIDDEIDRFFRESR